MSQSSVIGGALLAGFVVFLAARNRLTVYESVLWGAKSAPANSGDSGGGGLFGSGGLAGNIGGIGLKGLMGIAGGIPGL